jgi:hypothetical protein
VGRQGGGGADVYLETHGVSVFKRLWERDIMILIKEDLGPSIRYSFAEDCRLVQRPGNTEFQTERNGRPVRPFGRWDLGGALPRSELTGSVDEWLSWSGRGRVH